MSPSVELGVDAHNVMMEFTAAQTLPGYWHTDPIKACSRTYYQKVRLEHPCVCVHTHTHTHTRPLNAEPALAAWFLFHRGQKSLQPAIACSVQSTQSLFKPAWHQCPRNLSGSFLPTGVWSSSISQHLHSGSLAITFSGGAPIPYTLSPRIAHKQNASQRGVQHGGKTTSKGGWPGAQAL